jgi:outer membrane protein assembly factor BamB
MLGTRLKGVVVGLGVCWAFVASPALGKDGWTTYRGNPQRTGNGDGKAGPLAPKVLWAYKSKDHFIAAPVPHGKRLFVSGLGFINVSTFYSLDTDPKAGKRVVWTKTSPYLQQATVSSPAIAGGKLVFGDGMHQTNGATLYALRADGGLPLWQLPVPGSLVHLEGSPTVAGGRVYVGGGSAGVLCVDLNRVTLGGKELSEAAVVKLLEAKRKELEKKYQEARKRKDPFAVKPTDDDLPKPKPVRHWQQGKGKWHVDAPVAVVGERVLVASAYLDKEKEGRRALLCLSAKTGKPEWEAPLAINPWGGPSVSGNVVVVSGSSISYDPKLLKGAKGVVAAFDLKSGKPKWRKSLLGGVVSCVALGKGLAVATATDGRVRAYDLASGRFRWSYDARAALFAPVALSGEAAYAGDLKGVVHAINLKSGRKLWTLNLGADKAVALPGMIYAGPVLHGGRLYVATCNQGGEWANKPTAVVCIGEK